MPRFRLGSAWKGALFVEGANLFSLIGTPRFERSLRGYVWGQFRVDLARWQSSLSESDDQATRAAWSNESERNDTMTSRLNHNPRQ